MAAVRSPVGQPTNRPQAVRCVQCGHLASYANGPHCFFCGAAIPGLSPAPRDASAPREPVPIAPRQRYVAPSASPAQSRRVGGARAMAHPGTSPASALILSAAASQLDASSARAGRTDALVRPYPAHPYPAFPTRRAYNPFTAAALLLGLASVGITIAGAALGYYIFGYFSIYALFVALRGVLQGVVIRPHRGFWVSLLALILSGLAL